MIYRLLSNLVTFKGEGKRFYMANTLRTGWKVTVKVKVTIMQFHQTVDPSLWFQRDKFHPEILKGFPRAWASNKGGVAKTRHFLDLCVNLENCKRHVHSYY